MTKLRIVLIGALVLCALALITSQHRARRLFVDLYRAWRIPPDVQEVITGHDPVRIRGTVAPDHERPMDGDSSLRVYLDPSAHHLLVLAAQVMQHARTTYAATGARCPTLV